MYSIIRIKLELHDKNGDIQRHTLTMKPWIFPRRWILFYNGKRSKKHPTITITELLRLFSGWISG